LREINLIEEDTQLSQPERYKLKLMYLKELHRLLGLNVNRHEPELNRPFKIVLGKDGAEKENHEVWESC
jgi:hypothetical protein